MDASERARLRALCEAATPGPWRETECRDGRQAPGVEELGIAALDDPRSYLKDDDTWHGVVVCRGMDGPTRAANAALIAAARTALPALLALLDAAEERAVDAERERGELAEVARAFIDAVDDVPIDCFLSVSQDGDVARRDDLASKLRALAARKDVTP